MTLQIIFDLPAERQKAVEPIVNKLQWVVPSWLHKLRVAFDPNMADDTPACVNTSYPYRWATIQVGPGWFQGDTHQQTADIAHELLHTAFEPMMHGARRAMETWVPTEHSQAVMNGFVDGMESAVCDLTHAVMNAQYGDR